MGTVGKEKVKSQTFEYLATNMASLKSIALIFMIENLTSDGEKERVALSHDSEITSDNHILLRNSSLRSWKNL